MKKETLLIIVSIVLLVGGYFIGSFFPISSVSGSTSLNSDVDSFAYGVGLDMGNSIMDFAEQNKLAESFSNSKYLAGIEDGLTKNEKVMTKMDAQMHVQQFLMKQQQNAQANAQNDAAENMAKGQAFLEKNKTKKGVSVTESGLQYEIIEKGHGSKPAATDTVVVNYTGSLIDGTVFDSSVESGEPATFPVNAVIPGWTEALQLMSTGSKWKLYIPSDLAYGPRQRSEIIKANATLVFEVELMEIKGK